MAECAAARFHFANDFVVPPCGAVELKLLSPLCGSPEPSSKFAAASGEDGGGKGIRTPGLFIANEALYQLSYTPIGWTESDLKRILYSTTFHNSTDFVGGFTSL